LQVEVGDNTFVYDVPHSTLNMNAVDQAVLVSETLRSYGFNVYTVVADESGPLPNLSVSNLLKKIDKTSIVDRKTSSKKT